MKNYFLLSILIILPINYVWSMGQADPLLYKVKIDQLEHREKDGEVALTFKGEAWIGKDMEKLWLKSEIEKEESSTESSEIMLAYGKAVAAYWDLMVGVRSDIVPSPSRNWLAVGMKGTAPYFIDVEAFAFVGKAGRSLFRVELEQEWMITQKWALVPKVEIELSGKTDEEVEVGSGLSKVEAGLRLMYEVRREFAPYVGINYEKAYGRTADFKREEDEDTSKTQWVIGVHAWF